MPQLRGNEPILGLNKEEEAEEERLSVMLAGR
jgi:hypothetical protein